MNPLLEIPSVKAMWDQVDDKFWFCLPSRPLYHYTASIGAIKNILTEGELWLSKSTTMNDYSEISYGSKLFLEILEQESKKYASLIPLIEAFNSAVKNEVFGDIYILSLSENGESRLLWDSYSRKSGYCLEIDQSLISHFISHKRQETAVLIDGVFKPKRTGKFSVTAKQETKHNHVHIEGYANKVLYDKELQRNLFHEIIDYIRMNQSNKNYGLAALAMNFIIETMPFIKDPSLRDEAEYRLVVKITRTNRADITGKKHHLDGIQKYKEYENTLVPYIVLKMNDMIYVKRVLVGYCNKNGFATDMMKEFVSTLHEHVGVEEIRFSLRW